MEAGWGERWRDGAFVSDEYEKYQRQYRRQCTPSRASRSMSEAKLEAKDAAYWRQHERSLQQPELFWADAAHQLEWARPWDSVLDDSRSPFTKWFSGGRLSVCHNAVDRHVAAGRGGLTALLHDSPLTRTSRTISYAELLTHVAALAGALRQLGVRPGHRVLIYMPLIPEAVVAMLATNRLGAIHSVVFGGFAARELRARIEHAEPTVIVAASCGVEPNKIVRYKEILDEALSLSAHQPRHCVVFQRDAVLRCALQAPRDVCWQEATANAAPAPCHAIEANEPIYVLYTSGTTAAPKGVVRPAHHAVALAWSMRAVYGLGPPGCGDVWWAASDLGWVVGHSYICYAPLLAGLASVLYEGKPDRTPDPAQYYRVVEQHRVNALFTIPTAFRVLKKADPMAAYARRYTARSLRRIFVAGEHCDSDTRLWAERTFGAPVLDHWWQTETGSPVTAACVGLGVDDVPPATAGRPVPGYDVVALRADGSRCAAGEAGRLALRLPLPPGFASTLWRADDLFRATYFAAFPGFYDTQDEGAVRADGCVAVTARADDVINVAGHRLSTAALEDVVLRHARVADAAVVGAPDATKGAAPLCLFVLRPPTEREAPASEATVAAELVALVRHLVGPIAAFRRAAAVPALPRTRAGKLLRGPIARLARGLPANLPPTVEDATVMDDVAVALARLGYDQALTPAPADSKPSPSPSPSPSPPPSPQ